jgi:adenosylmethionine-8-amino-7-oxononanoate aminotransferase
MPVLISQKHLARPQDPESLDLRHADGPYLIDDNGRRYLDFLSSWCAGNLGWNNGFVRNAIRKFDGPDYVYPGLEYRRWDELAEMIARVSPAHLTRSFRATGGSEAVDTAMQIAMAYTGRHKFISLEGSYHGNSIGPLSIGDNDARKKIGPLLPGCMQIDLPLDEKAHSKLETRLKKKDVAAIILEPVVMNLGVEIPTQAFMEGARKLCTRYGSLLIADEVASGFGRTGKMFAIEHYGIEPDVMCIAKGLSAGYAPIGATVTTEKIYKKIRDKVDVYSTYGWHPLATEAAIAVLRYYRKNGEKLFAHVEALSQHFRTRLSQMEFKRGGRLNIIGMAIAIDLKKSSYAEKIKARCFENGLLLSAQEEKLVMFPPLNLTMEEADAGLDILENCI